MSSEAASSNSLWFPFTYEADLKTEPPLLIERGRGIHVIDTDGRQYIDGIGSWWVSILGHNHPKITAAVKAQLDKIEHVLMAGCVTPPVLELTSLLADLLPPRLTRIFYSDNGSTAVEVALKIALQYWALKKSKRTGFIALGGGYHGDTLGAMAVGNIPQYHSLFHERFRGESFTDAPYCYRCPMECNPAKCSAECMDSLATFLERQGERIAACIFEPMVQGAAGMRVYPAKVLTRLFELCQRYGVLTIADEVAMGFGRTGKMWACEHAGVVPDIMCLAKGLTGGYLPMAATAVSDMVYAEFRGSFPSDRIFHHGHTFTGNPLAASAAVATLKIIRENNLPAGIQSTMTHFQSQLAKFDTLPIVGDIRSLGMVGALELVSERSCKTPLPVERRIPSKICRRALDKGLMIRPLGNVIYFMPAFIITREQIDTMFEATAQSIREVMDEEAAFL